MSSRAHAARAFATLVFATVAVAQDVAPRPALELLGERALENDTFWPVFEGGEKLLADGDRAWLASLAGGVTLQRDAAFDAWHAALAASACGSAVRAALPLDAAHPAGALADHGSLRARCVTGVELAVSERLALAGEAAQRAWTARFEELAARSLAASARDPRTWRAVEREHPYTRAAARAALFCADDAFERGDAAAAQRWLVRARAHAARTESGAPDIAAACARRAALYVADARAVAGVDSSWNPAADSARETAAFDAALALEPIARIPLTPSGERGAETNLRALERTRVLNGACAAGAGAVWVQTPELVLRVAEGRETARVELAPLCARHGLALATTFADRSCDWPLVPASDGARVFAVLGRSSAAADNALACLAEGELAWSWSRAGRTPHADANGAAEWFGPGRVEFQPGPVALGATVFAQVRFWPATGGAADGPADDPDSNPLANGAGWSAPLEAGRVESWLCAFQATSGALLWSRFLARGALTESADDRANLGIRVVPSPAAPLALGAAGVAVATALGTLSLVDPLDGRLLWTLRTARARRGEPSNARARPVFDGERLVWRPEDGPYLLAFGPLGGADWSLDRARLETRPLAPASAWLGGAPERCVGLRAAGDGWEELADGAEPVRSLSPGGRDPLLALARVLPRRVLAVSETGLWLLDRTRELAVLDRLPLGAGEAGPVWLADGFALVLGAEQLTPFRPAAAPREKR